MEESYLAVRHCAAPTFSGGGIIRDADREFLGADAADLLSEPDGLDSAGQLEHALDLVFASLAN